MKKVIWLLLMTALMMLMGCAFAPKQKIYKNAAYLTYSLPTTAARVNMDLTLTQCKPVPLARAVITVVPVVSPSEQHRFTLNGLQLASFTKKREVDISLYPNGTIKSVNSTVSDRTGAILVNTIKIIGAVVALDESRTLAGVCTRETETRISQANEIIRTIQKLRDRFDSGSLADPLATQKQIDAWAAELGRIQSDYLLTSISGEILFPEKKAETGGVIQWTNSDFQKWFGKAGEDYISNFRLGWCISPADGKELTCSAQEIQRYSTAAVNPASIECRSDGTDCATTLVFREPTDAVLMLIAYGNDLVNIKPDVEVAQLRLPVAQWGDVSYFDFSAGFGESKAVSLSFDEYGRRASFGWKSGARGEEVTGGLQGVVDAAAAFSAAWAGQQVKDQKAVIDALETQQKLNKLRHCQAVIEAGGFVCPDQ